MTEWRGCNTDHIATKSKTFTTWHFTEKVCRRWISMNNRRKCFQVCLCSAFLDKGNPGHVLCSFSETNNPDDQGAVPTVKKWQKALCWQRALRSGRGGCVGGGERRIISAAGACRNAPLVAEEACLMCHNFPSVTRLNAHFQTLPPSGGRLCYNAGVRNPE